MDHPASLSGHGPWRTTALVASALAAFELILLVLIVFALFARPLLADEPATTSSPAAPAKSDAKATPAKAPKAAPAKPAPTPTLARNETLVIVLNGNGSQGAASEKADLVRMKGYMIAGTANAPRTDFARSVVMFRPGHRPEALRLAKDFGLKRVAPLDGMQLTELQGAHVAFIVGGA